MKTLFVLLLILFIPTLTAVVLMHAQSTLAAPEVLLQSPVPSELAVPTPQQSLTIVIPTVVPEQKEPIEPVIRDVLDGTKGKYSIVVKNLATGESYSKEEHVEHDSGSLYKLWVMATVYEQIRKGTLTEDTILSADIATLNEKFRIDPEYAEQTEGGITLSVEQALTQMITISHNYAAMLLSQKVRLSNVSAFLKEHGLSESKIGSGSNAPSVTAWDAALFMEKLYRGQLADAEHTQKMIDLLKAQKLNNKLPKYIPQDIVIAHKTGEIDQFSHDVGIVYAPHGPYVIAILSKSDNPPAAEDRLARVSEAVYQHYLK